MPWSRGFKRGNYFPWGFPCRGGRGFPTPVFSRQLGLFLLGYRGVFSIFWKRFNMFFLITKPGGNEGKQAKTQKQTRRKCRKTAGDGVPGGSGLQQRGPEGHCRPHSSPGTNRMKAFACLALPRRPKSRRGGHFLPGTLHFELTGLRCDCRASRDFTRGAPRVAADLI